MSASIQNAKTRDQPTTILLYSFDLNDKRLVIVCVCVSFFMPRANFQAKLPTKIKTFVECEQR